MKTYTTSQNQDFTIDWADALPAGHGHKTIDISVIYRDEKIDQESKDFRSVTSNMPDFDEALDLEGQEKYEALFELVQSDLEGKISEWIYEITK